jgi:hypothetical protein
MHPVPPIMRRQFKLILIIGVNATNLRSAVRGEKMRPNVLVLHETQLYKLLDDNKFIEYGILPSWLRPTLIKF